MKKTVIKKKAFGKKVKKTRLKNNLTQFELVEKLDLSQNFIEDIERGLKLPSLPKLIELCNTLKLSLDYLFYE